MAFLEIPNLLDQFSTALVKDHVGIIEFVEGEKFLGRSLYPRQRTLLKIIFLEELDDYDREVIAEWEAEGGECIISPKLEDRIDYLKKNGYPHFSTIQLVGGRRSSKGYITACAMAYKLYGLTLLEDMHEHFHIPAGKEVEFSIVAASLDQAIARQFADAYDAIVDTKPLLRQNLMGRSLAQSVTVNTPADLRRAAALRASGMKIDRDMASLVVQAHGTNSKTIRGAASMCFVFDEMAHLIGGESRMSDEELWRASTPSIRQFRQDAIIFANSSPYTKTGKFYELYSNAIELDPPEDMYDEKTGILLAKAMPVYPDHFMLQFPSWELYKDWDRFGTAPPQVYDPKEDEQLAREELADPDSFRVEYRAQFAEVIDAFLRPEMVDRMFDPIWNESILGYAPIPTAGAIGFMRYKGHGDPASVGANFGIAVGHMVEIVTEAGVTEQHVVFDLIDAFYPSDFDDNTIDWLEVVPEITRLINAYRPYEWTFDQFDSRMAIQTLEQNLKQLGIGETIVAQKVATPKSNERRWKNFRAALNLGRVHAPHPHLYNPSAEHNSIELGRDELKFLQEKNGRVDKQTIGPIQTKDIADCIAEVVDALIGDTIMPTIAGLDPTPAFGAQGGFNIGGGNTSQWTELADVYERRYPGGTVGHDPARGRKFRQR